MRRFAIVLSVWALAGCGSSGSGSGSANAASAAISSTSTSSPLAQYAQEIGPRKQAYLAYASSGTGYYAQLARLATGAPTIDRAPLDDLLDFMDARRDTADFKASALLRILYLFDQDPRLPSDWLDRADRTLLDFMYWVDEPGPGDMIFWSENHQILFASCEYLAGQRFPNETFSNSGLTGAQHRDKARARIIRWCDHRLRFGYSEWYSPVYYPHDMAPLLNLIDFAQDPELRTRASMALDLLVFDLARLTQAGNFGATAGRTYVEQKLGGRQQSVGDAIEILFGTRGEFRSRGSTAGTPLATSTGYTPPHVLLAIARQPLPRSVQRARNGISFAEAPQEGIGLQTFEDGMFWWGQGCYMPPETIVLSRDMIRSYDLYHYGFFNPLQVLDPVPDAVLPFLSRQLSAASEGTMLTGADTYAFRTPDAMLSSVESFRPGHIAFQQHAWQATLDLDAVVFTTHPGNLGRNGPGPWTGSASLPRVLQVEDGLVALYNPEVVQRATFPQYTHAYFPKAAFDEYTERNGWHLARKNQGYVALYSAQPTFWRDSGPYAHQELVAPGSRNAWVCIVGNAREDGTFTDFVNTVSARTVDVQGLPDGPDDPFHARVDLPDLGELLLPWDGTPSLDLTPLPDLDFPRYDTPYIQARRSDPTLTFRHANATLHLDLNTPSRTGEGL